MEDLTDSLGRKLALRKITVLEQAKMLRAIGPSQSQNEPYVRMVECACMVAAIDGVPLPMPVDERGIDLCLGKLGDEGISAIMIRRTKEIADVMSAAEAAALGGEEAKSDPLDQPAS